MQNAQLPSTPCEKLTSFDILIGSLHSLAFNPYCHVSLVTYIFNCLYAAIAIGGLLSVIIYNWAWYLTLAVVKSLYCTIISSFTAITPVAFTLFVLIYDTLNATINVLLVPPTYAHSCTTKYFRQLRRKPPIHCLHHFHRSWMILSSIMSSSPCSPHPAEYPLWAISSTHHRICHLHTMVAFTPIVFAQYHSLKWQSLVLQLSSLQYFQPAFVDAHGSIFPNLPIASTSGPGGEFHTD